MEHAGYTPQHHFVDRERNGDPRIDRVLWGDNRRDAALLEAGLRPARVDCLREFRRVHRPRRLRRRGHGYTDSPGAYGLYDVLVPYSAKRGSAAHPRRRGGPNRERALNGIASQRQARVPANVRASPRHGPRNVLVKNKTASTGLTTVKSKQ